MKFILIFQCINKLLYIIKSNLKNKHLIKKHAYVRPWVRYLVCYLCYKLVNNWTIEWYNIVKKITCSFIGGSQQELQSKDRRNRRKKRESSGDVEDTVSTSRDGLYKTQNKSNVRSSRDRLSFDYLQGNETAQVKKKPKKRGNPTYYSAITTITSYNWLVKRKFLSVSCWNSVYPARFMSYRVCLTVLTMPLLCLW